ESAAGADAHPNGLYVASIDSRERKQLLPGGSNAAYAQGYLLFQREQTLMAQPFDLGKLAFAGEASPVAENVFTGPGIGSGGFSVSDVGSFVYEPGTSEDRGSQLAWFDRNGKQISTVGDPGEYADINLSPDGMRAAVTLPNPAQRVIDLW